MPTKLGASLGIPWEKDFVTMASVQVRDTIYVAAQLSWDERGAVMGDTLEAQLRQAYANVTKLLERHSAKLSDVVEETVYVLDLKAALPAAQKVRREVFGEDPLVASSLVEVRRLADPKALVAIRATAKLDLPHGPSRGGEDGDQRRGQRGGRGRGMGGRGGMGGGGYGGPSPY
jgi:enamine deaminase RidA (YjgF/YER057c/UK114 family)